MFEVKRARFLSLCLIIPLLHLLSCDNPSEPSVSYPMPPTAQGPYPSNFATDVLLNVELCWEIEGTAGYYAYDIYFGLDENPALIEEEFAGTAYPIEGLDFDQTYYWKIVTRDIYGQETEGPVWNFTTFDGIYINEGFEGNFPPNDWFAGWGWERSGSAHSGDYCVEGYVSYYDKGDESGYVTIGLYTPWFENDSTDNRTLDLSFFYRLSVDYNDRGYAGSELIAEVENEGEIEEVPCDHLNVRTSWELFEYQLSTSDLGERFRLVFRCYAGGGAGGWGWARAYIDDVLLVDSEL